MRVHIQGDSNAAAFSKNLLEIGDGRVAHDPINGNITIPCGNIVKSIDELRKSVYPDLSQNFNDHNWLCERSILASKNDTVEESNLEMLKLIPGPTNEYKCIDSVMNETDTVRYPNEFLNSINSPSLQQSKLTLKIGAPVMLIRNIDPPRLCNGTRLVVKNLLRNVLQAKIITGCAKGEEVFIPRIPIIFEEAIVPFKRIQFPIKLCFSMTINKSQGQSLKITGKIIIDIKYYKSNIYFLLKS